MSVLNRMLVCKEVVMIDFRIADFAKLALAFFLALNQLPARTVDAHVAMLNMGDEIDGMTLTSGAKDAAPIWAFCSSEESQGLTVANCWVPQLPALAIGHVFLPEDHAFSKLEWSALKWALYIDDQLINLDALETYNYVSPILARDLSSMQAVSVESRAWDVVLANLQPGEHIIEGRVRTDVEEYRWIISLVIEAKPASYWKPLPAPEQADKIGSRCSPNGTWLSRFHGRCKLYG
jgi:hypothetical protein